MEREFKGYGIEQYIEDYCVVDLETTSINCTTTKIIEISAIKVRKGVVVEEFTHLINPQCSIPRQATAVNHITNEMVKDCPVIEDVLDEFLAFVDNDVIVGYNVASFDMNVIYDCVLKHKGTPFTNNYLDVYHAAKRNIPDIGGYKLNDISMYYSLNTEGEHRALKDCYLTKECFEHIYHDFGMHSFEKKSHHSRDNFMVKYSHETLCLQELQNILERITEDGEITVDELKELEFWVSEHSELKGNYPFDRICCAIDSVLEDGVITPEELEWLQNVFVGYINPVKCCSSQQIQSIVGKHVCITGEFNYGSREVISDLIQKKGGIIDPHTKKTTNYVAVGGQGCPNWKTGNYGSKIQKALEFNEKGQNIEIIEEKVLINYLVQAPDHEISDDVAEDFLSLDNVDFSKKEDWQLAIQEMLDNLAGEKNLPKHSLNLFVNRSRKTGDITSYSVCIYEPEYPDMSNGNTDPSRTFVITNITVVKRIVLSMRLSVSQFGSLGQPEYSDTKTVKSEPNIIYILMPIDVADYVGYIKSAVLLALSHYKSKSGNFGCCAKYQDCSVAGKCLHENLLYSTGCYYRYNLERGNAFYKTDGE